ncbi:uncharacterized protein LOC111713102 [Eurytemora carolleeae]|uniref:uncharacterized protein LOC111713102 n=1 Tax=Eurytemora carolleeae TaxID=1294199 RepID=UPI000C777F0C|nr:uncharacterized protein LOC111713102 [Eurytemora carolleeae]|eukprot:XP_023343665.1 uncharacterized protein LOC111713102 [Eurytemora affinis]
MKMKKSLIGTSSSVNPLLQSGELESERNLNKKMKRVDAKITMDPLGAIFDPLGAILETQLVSDQPHTTTSADQSADYLELDVLEQWKVFKKKKINAGPGLGEETEKISESIKKHWRAGETTFVIQKLVDIINNLGLKHKDENFPIRFFQAVEVMMVFRGLLKTSFRGIKKGESVEEANQKWFEDVSCIQPLTPRIMLQIMLMSLNEFQVYHLQEKVELNRVLESTRGIGNQVLRSYVLMFLVKMISCFKPDKGLFMLAYKESYEILSLCPVNSSLLEVSLHWVISRLVQVCTGDEMIELLKESCNDNRTRNIILTGVIQYLSSE